ncbi:MAG: hypothetical protein MUO52_12000 [Desulfobacterales bacterium]|nr:hypothetical protein [Desulfobacterales bacterium]
MSISFRKIQGKARFHNPLRGFALEEAPYEIRFDPLTGETGRVFDLPFKAERPDISETVRRSRDLFCPFCPETMEKSTPLFPEEVIPEGRVRVGEASLIPNMLPFDKYAGVSVFSHRHHIPMEELTPETMANAFSASQIFIKRVFHVDPLMQYASINWNYMPPSGSSMVHPHLQPNCGEFPTNEQRMQVEASKRYAAENPQTFWHDYMEAEKAEAERYLGEIGSTFWAMSFVPRGFLPDVWCLFSEHSSLIQVGEKGLAPFLIGLSRVLKYFNRENILSFNVSIFSVREDDHFRVNARICPRLTPRGIGNSDMAYFQTMHKESFTVRKPESVCQELREFFQD